MLREVEGRNQVDNEPKLDQSLPQRLLKMAGLPPPQALTESWTDHTWHGIRANNPKILKDIVEYDIRILALK